MGKLKNRILLAALASVGLMPLCGCMSTEEANTSIVTDEEETSSHEQKFTIRFVTNSDEVTSPIEASYKEKISLPSPQKEGYLFDGWYRDSSFTDPFASETMPARNITLYAKWSARTYDVYLDLGGDEATAFISVEYGAPLSIPVPVRTGYDFTGWEEEVPSVMPDHDLYLTATWEKAYYWLFMDISKPDVAEETSILAMEFQYGEEIEYPDMEYEGYTFTGWDPYTVDIMPYYDMYLTATWEINRYSITYVLNGGTLENPVLSYTFKDEVTLPTPVKQNRIFIGWYSDPEFENRVEKIEKGSQENVVLYAYFMEDNFTITYHLDGGTNGANPSNYTTMSSIHLENAVKEGYTFMGWYIDEACTKRIYNINPANDGLKGNIDIYAKWKLNS